MEIRLLLAPAYTRQALETSANDLLELLGRADQLESQPDCYAQFDWDLHSLLTQRAQNPVFRLLLNSFEQLYQGMAARYFSFEQCRQHSRNFYAALQDCIQSVQYCDA